jgi:hypothetical protein
MRIISIVEALLGISPNTPVAAGLASVFNSRNPSTTTGTAGSSELASFRSMLQTQSQNALGGQFTADGTSTGKVDRARWEAWVLQQNLAAGKTLDPATLNAMWTRLTTQRDRNNDGLDVAEMFTWASPPNPLASSLFASMNGNALLGRSGSLFVGGYGDNPGLQSAWRMFSPSRSATDFMTRRGNFLPLFGDSGSNTSSSLYL